MSFGRASDTSKQMASFCRVCGDAAELPAARKGSALEVHCERCGNYAITDTCASILGDPARDNALLNTDVKKASVGHWIRQRQRGTELPLLEADIAEQLAKDPVFPSLHDQREALLRLIANGAGGPGERFQFDGRSVQYVVGARTPSSLQAVLNELLSEGILTGQSALLTQDNHQYTVAFTVKGWLAYEAINRGKSASRTAVLLMPAGVPDLEGIWLPHLHGAVLGAGFGLNRIGSEPRPGTVDIRSRAFVRQARFLIVELTHATAAAAWIGGFADGLGKPVIYSCRDGVDAPFNVDHALRINWSPDRLDEAAERLTATILEAVPDAA